MIALVLTNLRRRRARTILTATGIAVGVATIVALLALTAGLEQRAGGLVHLGRADIGVFQRNAADPTTSVLPLALGDRLEARADVASATPLQLIVESIPADPAAVVFGAEPQGFFMQRLVLSEGRLPNRGEAVAGDLLADRLHLTVGERLKIRSRTFRISGISHAGIFFEDNGLIVPLRDAQRLAGRRADETTTFAVTLEPHVKATDAIRAMRRDFQGVQVIGDPEEAARLGANSFLISKAVPILVALALIVGGLGVANTMVMAILERQRELALLSTIGWSPGQLGALVMAEAVAVSLLGSALGLALGTGASELLVRALSLLDFIEPHFTAWGFGRALIVGLAIGVLGGLYPTWRVIRLSPAGVLARG